MCVTYRNAIHITYVYLLHICKIKKYYTLVNTYIYVLAYVFKFCEINDIYDTLPFLDIWLGMILWYWVPYYDDEFAERLSVH